MNAERAVATLLREAESAHGEYEMTVLAGVRDVAWPDWYARFLLDRGIVNWLPGLKSEAPEELASRLQALADAYDRDRPDAPWPEVYAARLVAEFGGPP